MLTVNGFDRMVEPRNVFIAIQVKITYLAGNNSMKLRPQTPHWQVHPHYLDFIDRPPPHPM